MPDNVWAELGGFSLEGQAFLHGQQYFADAEQADDSDQKVKSLEKHRKSVGHSQLTRDAVQADRRQGKAEHHGRDHLGHRLFAHADKAAKSEQLHGKILGRTKVERKTGQYRRQKSDQDHCEQRTYEGRGEGRGEGLGCPALLGHGIAVKSGCHRPGLARNIEQN